MNLAQRILSIVESVFNEEMTQDDYAKIVKNIAPGYDEPAIANTINWAMRVLKKNNRIVWFLRWFALKLMYLHSARENNTSHKDAIADGMEPVLSKFSAKAGIDRFALADLLSELYMNTLKTELEHYFDPNILEMIPKIQGYSFQWQTPQQSLDDFKKFEDEFKLKHSGGYDVKVLIRPDQFEPKAEKIIEFPDGLVWLNLNTHTSKEESRSGNNCGTCELGDSTLLSLRRPIRIGKDTYWKSELTSELTSGGKIRQLRHGNEKPDDEYHPYIMKLLLEYDEIVGFELPNYLPERTFKVDDLTEEEMKALGRHNQKLLEEPESTTHTDFEIYDELNEGSGDWLGVDNWRDARIAAKEYIQGLSFDVRTRYRVTLQELEVSENDIEAVDSERVYADAGEDPEEPECVQDQHEWVSNEISDTFDEVEVTIGDNWFFVSCDAQEVCRHCGTYRAEIDEKSSIVASGRGYHDSGSIERQIDLFSQIVYKDADRESEQWVENLLGEGGEEE